jgi:sec-independent protein translocase protein TatB
MFNVGGGELLVILLIALIVLGPQRLPEAARQVGRVVSEVRRVSSGFQNELKDAFDVADVEAGPRRASPTPLAATVAEADKRPAALRSAPTDRSGERHTDARHADDRDAPAEEPTVAPAVAAALDEIVTPLDPGPGVAAADDPPAGADGPDASGLGDARAAS